MKNNGSKVLKKVGKKWVAFALVGAGVALGNANLVSANEIVGTDVGNQAEVQASTEAVNGVENTDVEGSNVTVPADLVQENTEEVATSGETISDRSVNTEEPEIMLLEATPASQDVSNAAQSTATIEVNSIGNTENKYNVTVDTKIPEASNGDYVDYTFENLPVGDLEGKELKTNDGAVIGSLSVLLNENTFNNKVDNASKETIDSNTIYNSAIVRATFNENVNTLKDIGYSFSYTGQGINIYPNKDASTVKTKISSGSKVVAELDAPTLPYPKEKVETVIYMDGPYTFADVSENGDITASQLQLEIKSGEGGVKAGTDYTLSWTDDSNFKLKPENIEVGTELRIYNQGAYTDSSYVNEAGYIFYDKVPSLSVKISSVTDKSITVTTLSDLPENTKFGSTVKGDVFVVSPTESQLDVSRSRITSVENISTVNGVVKDVDQMDYVNLKGSVASAVASKKTGTVVENNVSTTGEKLTGTITVADNVTVGTAYDTSAQDEKITLADGRVFKLKTKGANSVGTVVEGTTEVVNTYEEVKGTVIENNVSTTGEKLTDTITVVSNVSVGTAYDTSAQEEKIKLADGRVFKLKTKGANSTGKVVEGTTEVVNTYEEVKGTVIENNVSTTGEKLTDTITVVSNVSVGTAYDTSAQEEKIKLADGRVFKLKTKGANSTGKVVEGTTEVVNTYEEVKGTVIENNVSTTGEKLTDTITVVSNVSIGTAYDTSAQEEKIKLADGRVFKLKTKGANSTGKVVEGTAEVVNVYEEVKSSVYEDNFIEGTTTKLTDTATVVSKASVGSAYDSLAQDEVITLADGKSYKLVSKATNSTGKVAETDIYLANYYSEIKGSVLVKYVDTAGNTISEDVVDTEDSSTGVSYDTTDNKPTMILVKNADDTVTAYAFKEISVETSAETGKVVAGETVVTYVYEEVAIVPVKDVLNKDGETVDGGKATVGDVLTFVLDGSPISDGIQGGLWQYDLKDVLDTAKVEYIDGSVKVYAGEFANITLPDGSVLKADDDISSYVTIEYVDGMLTIKPIEEFYTILKDNGVEDLVDIDAQFDVKVIADGTIENTLIQIVNGFEFKSNKTTTEAGLPVVETPVEPKTDEPVNEVKTPVVEESKQSKASLPNTGTENSYALSLMGVLALFGSLLGLRKKKELE